MRINQIAENYYTYNGKTIAYIISAPYRENSWGVDFEDPIEKKYTEKLHNCKVDITVYKIDKNEGFGYAAEFKYNNIDYLLTGTMRQQEFDELLKSLFFPK